MNESIEFRIVILTALVVILGACTGAKRSLYAEAGEGFSRGFESGHEMINESLSTVVRDARRLALVRYLQHGDEPNNLDNADIDASFARYVCVGTGRYPDLRSALSVLNEYRQMVADLSAAPSEEIGQLWGSIKRLQGPRQPLQLKQPSANDYALCVSRLSALLPPAGQAIVDPERKPAGQELAVTGILSAFEALTALIAATERVAVLALRQVDEAARARAVQTYVLDNQETIHVLIGDGETGVGGLSDAALGEARHNRMSASLIKPYYRFRDLMDLDRVKNRSALVDLEADIHHALAEFDALYRRPHPQNIAAAMRGAQADLVRLARGELTPGEARAVFDAFAITLNQLHGAVQDLVDSAGRLRQATGG